MENKNKFVVYRDIGDGYSEIIYESTCIKSVEKYLIDNNITRGVEIIEFEHESYNIVDTYYITGIKLSTIDTTKMMDGNIFISVKESEING